MWICLSVLSILVVQITIYKNFFFFLGLDDITIFLWLLLSYCYLMAGISIFALHKHVVYSRRLDFFFSFQDYSPTADQILCKGSLICPALQIVCFGSCYGVLCWVFTGRPVSYNQASGSIVEGAGQWYWVSYEGFGEASGGLLTRRTNFKHTLVLWGGVKNGRTQEIKIQHIGLLL